jgi:hypothetical protein
MDISQSMSSSIIIEQHILTTEDMVAEHMLLLNVPQAVPDGSNGNTKPDSEAVLDVPGY